MRIYTGAAFARYREVRAINDALRAAGHEITHDWTRTDEFDAEGNCVSDGYALPRAVAADHALMDAEGVRTAELVLLLGHEASCGWLTEFGMALAYGVPEILVVAPFRPSVFWALPQVIELPDVTTALRYLGVTEEVAS